VQYQIVSLQEQYTLKVDIPVDVSASDPDHIRNNLDRANPQHLVAWYYPICLPAPVFFLHAPNIVCMTISAIESGSVHAAPFTATAK
jgi:hypothetical protein